MEVSDEPRLAGQRARTGKRSGAGAGGGARSEIRPADFSFQFQPDEAKGGKTLDDVERAHIERILRETEHNLSRAARILDIDRTTLVQQTAALWTAVKPIHLIPLSKPRAGWSRAWLEHLAATLARVPYAVPDTAGDSSTSRSHLTRSDGSTGRRRFCSGWRMCGPGRARARGHGTRSVRAGADVCFWGSSAGRQLRACLDRAAERRILRHAAPGGFLPASG